MKIPRVIPKAIFLINKNFDDVLLNFHIEKIKIMGAKKARFITWDRAIPEKLIARIGIPNLDFSPIRWIPRNTKGKNGKIKEVPMEPPTKIIKKW